MKTTYFFITFTLAFAVALTMANADTVTTRTLVRQQDIPHVSKVDLTMFDMDKNGILTMNEVGQYLFNLFDTDGNESIDNIEFTKPMFVTLIPMEQHMLKLVDFDDDGRTDISEHTYENFMRVSRLGAFDENKNGLSANEFIGQGYEELDDDNDRLINLHEWEKAYKAMATVAINDPALYNK